MREVRVFVAVDCKNITLIYTGFFFALYVGNSFNYFMCAPYLLLCFPAIFFLSRSFFQTNFLFSVAHEVFVCVCVPEWKKKIFSYDSHTKYAHHHIIHTGYKAFNSQVKMRHLIKWKSNEKNIT